MQFNLALAVIWERQLQQLPLSLLEQELDECKWMPGIHAISKLIGDDTLQVRTLAALNLSYPVAKNQIGINDCACLSLLQSELDFYRSISNYIYFNGSIYFSGDGLFDLMEIKVPIAEEQAKLRLAFGCRWGWSIKERYHNYFTVNIPGIEDDCKIEANKCQTHWQNCNAHLFLKAALFYRRDKSFNVIFDRPYL